jgi:hypothetical protein
MYSITVVVAKYKEDMGWLEQLRSAIPHVKTVVINKGADDYQPSIALPNIGRESHSYLWYIINNYDNLDDFTCFVQGDPFAHSAVFVDLLRNFTGGDRFYPFGPVYYTIKDACPNHPGLFVSKFDSLIPAPEGWSFHAGAQFIVSRSTILKNSRDFYQKLLDAHLEHEDTPWCLERLWRFVFNR